MKNILQCAFAAVALVAFAGCSSDEMEHTENYPSILIEPSDNYRGPAANIVMPETGIGFRAIGRPVVPEGNFMGAMVMEVGPAELRREVILVQLDDLGAGALYKLSVKAQGNRFFLLMGEKPVGVHLIQSPVRSGDVFFDVEVPGATEQEKHLAIHRLCADLNEAILEVRKAKAEQK